MTLSPRLTAFLGRAGPILLVAAAAWLPYSGVLRAPFVFDDEKLVRDNETIRDLSRIPETFDIFSRKWDDEDLRPNYRPLRFLSYAIDYRITRALHGDFRPEDLPATVFHVHNLLLHGLNALLLLGIGRRLLGGDRPAALVLALLFAVHPLMTEAVTYVSGRRDVLSTFFFLAALRVYLGAAGGSRVAAGERERLPLHVLVAVPVLFILGLLSKEMVVTLPAVLLLIDLARRARFDGRRIALALVLWALALGFTAFEASHPRLVAGASGGSNLSAVLTAPRFAMRYLGLLIFPYPQSIDYSFDAIPPSEGLLDPATTLPSILLAGALGGIGLWCLVRRRFVPAVGLLWLLGTLAPVLQIVPIPERFAERFAYLPSIGLFLLAGGLFAAVRRRSPAAAWAVAAAAVVLLGSLARLRNGDWQSPLALWGSAARAQPRCARAHLAHGAALARVGQHRDAARECTVALEILGDAPPPAIASGDIDRARSDERLRWGQVLQARNLRAEAQGAIGRESPDSFEKAAEDYRWLLDQRDSDGTPIGSSPRFFVHRFNLANCLLGLAAADPAGDQAKARRAEAAGEYRRVAAAIEVEPELARRSRYYLSKIARIEGRPDDELAELEEAWRIALKTGTRLDRYYLVGELADLLLARKALDRADDVLAVSLEEMGDLPDRKNLLYRRSQVQDRRGDLSGAASLLEESLRVDPEFAPALLTLAGIEENRGNLGRAEELYRRLLQAAPGEERALQGLRSIAVRRDLAAKGETVEGAAAKAARERETVLKAMIDRGEGHFAKGELIAAGQAFGAALEKLSEDPGADREVRARVLRRLGNIARDLRDIPKAEKYLAGALDADPGSREALRDMGDLQLRELKNRAAAEDAYRKYLESLPPDTAADGRVLANLASLVQDRDPVEAIDLFRSAEKAEIGDPAARRRIALGLGYLLARQERWEEALEKLGEFLDRSEAAAPADPGEARERERARAFIRDRVLPHVPGGEDLVPGEADAKDRKGEDGR